MKVSTQVSAVCFVLVGFACSRPTEVIGHDQVPGSPQKTPIVIRDATLHVVDGDVMPKASIVWVDGKITAIGGKVQVPDDAVSIDGTGKHVYPGLIESMTDLGLREISAVDVTVDRTEIGEDNPNVRAWVAVNPDSELIPVARAGGVLLGNVTPGGSFLRGQSSLMVLDGWTAADMNVQAPSGLCVNWEAIMSRGDEDAKLIAKREENLKKLDDWLDRAERYEAAQKAAIKAGRGDSFAVDVRLESLLPVIHGELPIIADADRLATIESAVAYARSRSLKLIIYGGYDAESCAELLKAADVPVIVAATYRLPLRRSDAYDASYTLPQRLHEAGVRFAICGEGPNYPGGASNARNLPYHAACAVAYGLDRDVAVRAITLSPAEIFGVQDRLGSLSVGKDATLILVDGDVLESESNVEAAFIGGRAVDLGSRHKSLFDKYRQKYADESRPVSPTP